MFEYLGYFKEYYINSKLIGMVNNCEKDRDTFGYLGKTIEVVKDQIILSNGKKIKANTEVMTMLFPLCGKMVK